jgi:hypothetical protein
MPVTAGPQDPRAVEWQPPRDMQRARRPRCLRCDEQRRQLARGLDHRAEPDHPVRGYAELGMDEMRERIDRIRDDQDETRERRQGLRRAIDNDLGVGFKQIGAGLI